MAFISTSHASTGASTSIFARLTQAFKVRRQRQQLAHLDAAALRDMGLTRFDVAEELKRSAWDVPCHWRG